MRGFKTTDARHIAHAARGTRHDAVLVSRLDGLSRSMSAIADGELRVIFLDIGACNDTQTLPWRWLAFGIRCSFAIARPSLSLLTPSARGSLCVCACRRRGVLQQH